MTPPLLEVRNLCVEFRSLAGTVHANRGVSYTVEGGETLAVLGESGSGKSVSASAVMGILDSPPGYITAGEALLEGRDLFRMTPAERRAVNGGKIGMVFQDSLAHLNPVYTVGWQIAEALRAHKGMDGSTAKTEALRLLDRVGIPDAAQRVDSYPHQFSGGQRQRVMIAMALANAPSLLIADEPTSALDVTVQAQILELLRGLLAESGMGLLMITHDLGVVADIADKVVVMHDGRIVESGPVRDVLRQPRDPYTRRLLDAVPGRHGHPPARPPATETPLLECRRLAKHYPAERGLFRAAGGQGLRAVDDVSLELRRGETLGIVGESGSGKSTLGRMILALDEPTEGSVRFAGHDIAALKGRELLDFRRRVQAVFQDPFASLNPRMTVFELISEPWTIHPDVLPRSQWRAEVERLLGRVGLKPEHALRWPHQFSGGQRQRIAIARALALKPDIVVCDEAVSALDVSVQAQVIELLAELRDELGLSYIFIAHDLPVVRDIADRVAVMQRGRIVETGLCDEIFDRPQHPYTQALLAASPVADPDEQARRRKAAKAA